MSDSISPLNLTYPDTVRRFALERDQDESGISGVGRIAVGAQFSDGQCVLKWLTHVNSLAVYPNIDALVRIHGHNGLTRLVWTDPDLVRDKSVSI